MSLTPEAYVTGSPLSERDIRAVRRNHPQVKAWSHDSLLPRKIHWLWIVPLHGAFVATAYAVFNFPMTNLSLGLAMLTSALGGCLVWFWDHVFLNRRAYILQRTRLVYYDVQGRHHGISWVEEWHSTALRYITSYWPWRTLRPIVERPRGFPEWLKAQLSVDAPYFGRVHLIVDAHLHTIQYARQQLQNGVSDQDLSEKLDEAGDVTFELLRPIFEESEALRLREEKELSERKDSETSYTEAEGKSLTAQRIAMASEDLDVFIEGHKALSPD